MLKKHSYVLLLFYLFVGCILTACGQKGPLYLQDKSAVSKKEPVKLKTETKKLPEKENQKQ